MSREKLNLSGAAGQAPGSGEGVGATPKSPKKWALVIREIDEEDKDIFPALRDSWFSDRVGKYGLFMEHYYANRTEIDLIATDDDIEQLEKIKREAEEWE